MRSNISHRSAKGWLWRVAVVANDGGGDAIAKVTGVSQNHPLWSELDQKYMGRERRRRGTSLWGRTKLAVVGGSL
jgi:hypothetical protein